jgi:ubiquinone/menaquinone biosynthesis C-methylase UbiE
MMFTPRRIETDELLDEHDAPREEMERSLRDLRRINRYLGGQRIYRKLIRRLLGGRMKGSILDLGTGTADKLDALRGELYRVGLDFKIDHLLYQRDGSPTRRVVGDAQRLPFRDGSVDVVTSAHLFHHFSPHENVTILGEAMRVARVGVAVDDTRRHYVPLLFVLLLSALRLFGRITRFDAPASVRQAYTTEEVRDVARQSGVKQFELLQLFPFRFGLLLWKPTSRS